MERNIGMNTVRQPVIRGSLLGKSFQRLLQGDEGKSEFLRQLLYRPSSFGYLRGECIQISMGGLSIHNIRLHEKDFCIWKRLPDFRKKHVINPTELFRADTILHFQLVPYIIDPNQNGQHIRRGLGRTSG